MKTIKVLAMLLFCISAIQTKSQCPPTDYLTADCIGFGSAGNTMTSTPVFTYSLNVLKLGTNIPQGGSYFTDYDPMMVIARTTNSATATNAHGFVDATIFTRSGNNYANNCFTDNTKIVGSANYKYHSGFESNFNFNGTGYLSTVYGLVDIPAVNSGTVINRFGANIFDVGGSGTVTNNFGIYVRSLSRGTNNYSIYTEGTTPSQFNGTVYCMNGANMYNYSGNVGTESKLFFTHGSSKTTTANIADDIQSGYSIMRFNVGTTPSWTPLTVLKLDGNANKATVTKLNISSIPTSTVGLSSGDIYNSGGTLMIMP